MNVVIGPKRTVIKSPPPMRVATIRLDAAIVAQLDKHAAAAEGGPRPR
jgi:hypothetical protein